MGKLLKEAALDDRFNTQLKKIQDAIDKLTDVVTDMKKPGSNSAPTATQKMQLKYAAEDLKSLLDRAQ